MLHSVLHLGVGNVRVNLGCIKVFVTENVLENAHVNAVLIHKSCGGMAQLVHGNPHIVQAACFKTILDNLLNAAV